MNINEAFDHWKTLAGNEEKTKDDFIELVIQAMQEGVSKMETKLQAKPAERSELNEANNACISNE
jgi:hypothetical protein